MTGNPGSITWRTLLGIAWRYLRSLSGNTEQMTDQKKQHPPSHQPDTGRIALAIHTFADFAAFADNIGFPKAVGVLLNEHGVPIVVTAGGIATADVIQILESVTRQLLDHYPQQPITPKKGI